MTKDILPKALLNAMEFEEKTLPSGLSLRLLPMPGFSSAHVIYSSGFGAMHREFMANGQHKILPAGVAHFLEHKLFENENGEDAFNLFAKTGAMANAYTGFERTSYIFTATEHIEENLDILLSFVNKPYFTEESVQKEQGIIAQEIKMYDDNPDSKIYFSLLKNLYSKHPLKEEIAGTVESIAQITPEMLYDCCKNFYSPANMVLCAAGNIKMEQLEEAVQRCELPNAGIQKPEKLFAAENREVHKKESSLSMPVAIPHFALGFKEKTLKGNTLETEVACNMLTELLFGETSSLYQTLYDSGLVQPDFGGEYGVYSGTLHFVFSGESFEPYKVKEEIEKEIKRQRKEGIDKYQFEVCKKMMYGDSVAELENVEKTAYALSSSFFKSRTPAEELMAIAAITPEDVQEALETMLDESYSSFITINPSENGQ